VKNRFQSLPFKCNLKRYTAVAAMEAELTAPLTPHQQGLIDAAKSGGPKVGLCTLNQVDS
jgi:hypothetical protein